jgi:cysteine-rich repeat protein
VILRNFTVQNGHAVTGGSLTSAKSGGGITVHGGNATLDSLLIRSNFAGNGFKNTLMNTPGTAGECGGGLSVLSGTVTLINSTVTGNAAGKGGNGSATNASGGKGGNGGGICVHQGTVAIRNTTISGNNSGVGGDAAGSGNGGDGGDGGGLFLDLSIGSATVTLNNVTVTGNSTGIGGDGTAAGSGGDGGGIAHGSGGTLNVGNSLIAGNEVGGAGTGLDCAGAIVSAGFNLLGIGTACAFTGTDGVNGDDVGTLATPLNPLLDSAGLADNGGPTQTIAIQASSPAKDAGDNATCEATDQRGEARAVSGPGVCDKGAFEITGCGDGAVQSGETCDDGNLDDGDGCDAVCQTEAGATAGSTTGGTTTAGTSTATGTGSGTATAGGGGNNGGGCSLIR